MNKKQLPIAKLLLSGVILAFGTVLVTFDTFSCIV